MKKSVWIVLAAVTVAGCSTVKTTFTQVDSGGAVIACPDRPVKGVPAIAKVPTHIDVEIKQTDYWIIETNGKNQGTLKPLPEATARSVVTTEIQTDRLVLLDPKRPCSGEGKFKIAYNTDEGTVKSINYKAVDDTLAESITLATNIAKLAKTANKADPKNQPQGGLNKVFTSERTIAKARFALSSSCEEEVQAFIAAYINDCSLGQCNQSPNYCFPQQP